MSNASGSADESIVLIVDPLPLRNLGLVSVLDRLVPAGKFKVVSLPPDDAEKSVHGNTTCSMIIYNVGGESVADPKHLKRIRVLLRARTGDMPLVVFSDNNNRTEVLSALNAGAQGYLFAGTDLHLARQALCFILKGGSYFPAVQPRRGRSESTLPATSSAPIEARAAPEIEAALPPEPLAAPVASVDLTDRQKAVLGGLGRGDSNKAIARELGIREGTVKVHVRQIMRKLGVANRTQVVIACAGGAGAHRGDGITDKLNDAAAFALPLPERG